jgi:hypothetical protein
MSAPTLKQSSACTACIALLLQVTDAAACAGCRNPSLAVGRSTDQPIEDGVLRLGATITATTIHVIHEAGCTDLANCDEVPIQPLYLHDQHLYPVELRAIGEYSFNSTWGVEAQLPFRAVTTRIEYTTPSGAPYQPLDTGVHHRDETVSGIADAWLLLRVATTLDKWWLAARPGISLPIGATRADPFELGDQGLKHQHIQLGTGTFDPLLVLEAFRQWEALRLGMYVQGQASLYDNSHGYRAPWRLAGGASVGTTLIGKLSGSLGPELFHENEEHWQGKVRQDGSLGRTEILATATLTQRIGSTDINLGARVPLWRHIVESSEAPGKLTSPLTIFIGVSHQFGASEPQSTQTQPNQTQPDQTPSQTQPRKTAEEESHDHEHD